ncbi:Rpn family recombination-promoting nuclease/putative transposase [Halonatronum saccharophilum]|uniref:Rpn family recombination-promoting nuclease/putative transposase n=1 Tax=Halonatronum saccharophilum TaxID=150060 RepID=UPI0004892411|nr:Rpn family recombination-promoting nuclease/putative transposase [Halonatronum saccharophilum]
MCRLNPRVDFAFKKLFGSEENKDILISFINSVLDKEDQIKDLILKNPYNAKNFKNDKLSILDVKAIDQKGVWYNIEMQITDQDYYDKRALYYWARLYTGQLESGVNYDKLEKTIVINLLNFNCLDEEDYHNVYKLLNRKSKEELIDHLEIHFIELDKYNKDLTDVQTTLDRWTEFLKKAHEYNKDKIPAQLAEVESIQKAIKVLDTMYLNEDERELYEARLKWLRDEEMALKKAEEKGMARGIQKGMEKGKKEMVDNLLKLGVEIDKIAQASGLTKEEIRELRNSNMG